MCEIPNGCVSLRGNLFIQSLLRLTDVKLTGLKNISKISVFRPPTELTKLRSTFMINLEIKEIVYMYENYHCIDTYFEIVLSQSCTVNYTCRSSFVNLRSTILNCFGLRQMAVERVSDIVCTHSRALSVTWGMQAYDDELAGQSLDLDVLHHRDSCLIKSKKVQ
jgi:hypothetical protein